MRLKVMTFNIHHGENVEGVYALEGIAEVIRAARPDVVALQEVDRRWGARSGWEDQPARLAELTGMTAHFGAALEREGGGEYGNLILSRLPVLERETVRLPRLEEGSEQRCAALARVELGETGVWVCAMHLQHNSAAERAAQVEALQERVGGYAEPVVVAGDFNAEPHQEELGALFERLTDGWSANPGEPGHTFPSHAPRKRIDYVFASGRLRAMDARVVETRASDHLPVVVELAPPERAQRL